MLPVIYRAIFPLLMISLLTGCSTVSYYSQSIHGQLSVMQAREPIDGLLQDSKLEQTQREQLEEIQRARHFATEQLGLPDNQSYTSYVALDEDFIIWNVFATPALSLDPVQSCFLIVGCLEYRGYFTRKDAETFAQSLRDQGLDVFLGGVSAYSTLGWFDDPVFSSMLRYGQWRTIETIFHELAHQKVYIKNDSAFNEAFATAVADLGLERYLAQQGKGQETIKIQHAKEWEEAFIHLVLAVQTDLEKIYDSERSDQEKLKGKKLRLEQFKKDYQILKHEYEPVENYDKWVSEINNARIASVVTYFDQSQSFKRLFDRADQDFSLFYEYVAALGTLPRNTRHACLNLQNPLECLSLVD